MTDDPLDRYAATMKDVHAPAHLPNQVMRQILMQDSSSTSAEHQTPDSHTATHQAAPAKKRHVRGLALAACLALLVVVVGVSLALPRVGTTSVSSLGFDVRAYAASGDTILAMGEDGRILFEADILARIPESDRYTEEGVYTGCMFRVEGDNIVRVKAHIDRGELYRYTSDEFSKASDPERWEEALAWTTASIGIGAQFGSYDLVRPFAVSDGTQGTADQQVGIGCYQRLGDTIDIPLSNEDGSRLSDYSFGFWTNLDAGSASGYQDYLDTLDGATLTVTIEKADGSCSTKVIELSAADVKAKMTFAEGSATPTLELTSEIVDPYTMDVQEKQDNRHEGFTYLHTLYGTIVKESSDPFPYIEPSRPLPNGPFTGPDAADYEPLDESVGTENAVIPEASREEMDENWTFCRTLLAQGSPLEVRFPQDSQPRPDGSTNAATATGTLTCSNLSISTQLPTGTTTQDLVMGDSLEEANELWRKYADFEIAPDGSLTPGFSYATVDVAVTNTSTDAFDTDLLRGNLGTMRQVEGERYFTGGSGSGLLWISDMPARLGDRWNRFDQVLPGETKTYTVLFVIAEAKTNDSALAYYFNNTDHQGRTSAAFLLNQG